MADNQKIKKAFLEIIKGEKPGQKFFFSEELSIGRSVEANIFLPDPKVSRYHAKIYFFENSFFIEDLISNNGTFLNGKKIQGEAKLSSGDIIKIGSSEFLFKTLEDEKKNAVSVYERKKVEEFKIPSLRDTTVEAFFDALEIPLQESETFEDRGKISGLILKAKNLAILYDIAREAREHFTLQSLFDGLSKQIAKVLDADSIAFYLVDPDTHAIEVVFDRYLKPVPKEFEGISRRPSQTLIELVLRTRSAILSGDTAIDERFKISKSIYAMKVRSLLAVPLIYREKTYGVIALLNFGIEKQFKKEEMDFLIIVANLMAVSIQNIKLFEEQKKTIEELKRTKDNLILTQDELIKSEKIALIGKFSAGILHEIKNVLSPLTLGSLLLEKYPDNEDIVDYIENLNKSYNMILTLLNELKTFVTAEESFEEPKSIQIKESIENVLSFLKFDPDIRYINIIKEFKYEKPLKVNHKKLNFVLINLIRNASSAIKGKDDGFVKIETYDEDGFVCISIIDNGEGIDDDLKEKVWEPFVSTKGGAGLGLYMAKKMVQSMNGIIFFTSKKGSGTTFKIKLPYIE